MIHSDVGVYVLDCHHKWGDSKMNMILILYVDHLLLLGEDLSKIEDIKHQLGKLNQMKDLGPASYYSGIRITRDQNTQAVWIDQQVYVENALKRFKLQDANFKMQTTPKPHSQLEFIWRNPKNQLPSTPRHITNRLLGH